MARALLVLLAALALPAGAEAASKTVKMRLPSDGGISVAQYRVTTAAPGKAVIRNSRRLGDAKVSVLGRRVRGRRYEVTVVALNPRSGASAAQTDTAISILLLTSRPAPIAAAKTGAADNVLSEPATPRGATTVSRLCARPRARGRGRFFAGRGSGNRRIRVRFTGVACQEGTPQETLEARTGLESLGAAVPSCMGTTERFGDSATEVVVRAVCTEQARLFSLRAQPGNAALDCLAPSGASCTCGPACRGTAEDACFASPGGLPVGTLMEFRAAWTQPVKPEDVAGIWVPQGSPVLDTRPAYLRAVQTPR